MNADLILLTRKHNFVIFVKLSNASHLLIRFNVGMGNISRRKTIILSIISIVLILFASFSIWFDRIIFSPQKFSEVTTNAILSEDSRQSISKEIVDKALGNRPIINQVVGPRLESVVASLLDSSISRTVVEKVSVGLQKQITSSAEEEISIDTTVIKSFVKPLSDAISPNSASSVDVNAIPDTIVILKKGAIPSIYSWASVVLWLGPVSLVFGVCLFAYIFYENPEKEWVLKIFGGLLAFGGFIVSFLPYLFEPAALASFENENIKTVLGSVYRAFSLTLSEQFILIGIFGLILVLLGFFIKFISNRKKT